MIEAENLGKKVGEIIASNNLTFQMAKGEVFGML
jgi:ABC-type multidrug transport system ATPase subunit